MLKRAKVPIGLATTIFFSRPIAIREIPLTISCQLLPGSYLVHEILIPTQGSDHTRWEIERKDHVVQEGARALKSVEVKVCLDRDGLEHDEA